MTIDETVRFRSRVSLNESTSDEYYLALNLITEHYKKAGFIITIIHCEERFKTLMNKAEDKLDITMDSTGIGGRILRAKQNVSRILEQMRADHCTMHFKKMLTTLFYYLALVTTKQMNLTPAVNGISSDLSPHAILTGELLSIEKYREIPFGVCVIVCCNLQQNNNNRPIDALYLRPIPQKGHANHEVLGLYLGQIVSGHVIKQISFTDLIIKTIEDIADSDSETMNFCETD